MAEAFARFAGIDLLADLSPTAATDRDGAAGAAAPAAGIRIAADDTWSDIFSRVLVEKVEPHLGIGRPTILCEYPVSEAALARAKPGDPRVAERFELYACGVELANGFGELTDAAEQRRRFEAEMDEKERIYGERYPIDEDFLAALAAHAGGQRRRARPRPAGDAGDRRAAHRAGAMDAGGRRGWRTTMNDGAPWIQAASEATLREGQPADLGDAGLRSGGGSRPGLPGWKRRRLAPPRAMPWRSRRRWPR